MEIKPKVKGRKNENDHSEMMNNFGVFVTKSRDKRDRKREILTLHKSIASSVESSIFLEKTTLRHTWS